MKNRSIVLVLFLVFSNTAFANSYKTNDNLLFDPLFKAIKIDKNKVIVSFDYAGGLCFLNNKSDQFEIAAAKGLYYESNATIEKEYCDITISLSKKTI